MSIEYYTFWNEILDSGMSELIQVYDYYIAQKCPKQTFIITAYLQDKIGKTVALKKYG